MHRNKRITYIVILVLILTAIIYLFRDKNEPAQPALKEIMKARQQEVNLPETALLVLSDESVISPDTLPTGGGLTQGHIQIVKAQKQELAYIGAARSQEQPTTANFYNTLKTSPKTKYLVTFTDGTQVWMNTGSSITFPLEITNQHSTILMSGEIYMEASIYLSEMLHIQTDDGSVITVSEPGTAVNINAYKKNDHVAATVVQGKAVVNKKQYSMHLVDDEQSFIDLSTTGKNPTSKKKVSAGTVTDWKHQLVIRED